MGKIDQWGICGIRSGAYCWSVVGIGRKDRAGHVVRVRSGEWFVVGESTPETFPTSNTAIGVCEN